MTSPRHDGRSSDRLTDRISLGVLTRLFNRDLVDEVLAETGTTEQRLRLLPARVVVYYVMALTELNDKPRFLSAYRSYPPAQR